MLAETPFSTKFALDLINNTVPDIKDYKKEINVMTAYSLDKLSTLEEMTSDQLLMSKKGQLKKVEQAIHEAKSLTFPLVITNVINENRLYEANLFGTRSEKSYLIVIPDYLENSVSY